MSEERCPSCGALYAMVGRSHRCVVRKPPMVPAPKRETRVVPTPKRNVTTAPKRKVVSAPKKKVAPVPKRKTGRPRVEDIGKTLTATKPWEKLGMSERTWFRRQKEKADKK